jgi:hypothetical protein
MIARIHRLILTLISKQWLVFFIGTWLLWNKCITPEVWVVLASVVIGVNVYQKAKGVSDAAFRPDKPLHDVD